MPLFEITTVNMFKSRYVVQARSVEDAYDTILMDRPEELSQCHLDETIIDGRRISHDQFYELLKKVRKETDKLGALDNAHLGQKIIHRADYSDA